MQELRNVLGRLSTRGFVFFLISFLTFSVEAQAAMKPAPKPLPGPKPQAISATTANSGGSVRVWLDTPRPLTSRAAGTSVPAVTTAGAQAQPLALASGDFNEDGVEDLVAAYGAGTSGSLAIYRGNLDAFAPQSKASFDGIAKGQFPDPFLATPVSVNLAVRPDFVAAGDFNGDGHADIAVGSRSGAALYILFGDGKGNFTQPMALALPAGVTAMAAKRLDPASPASYLVVGVGGDSPKLLLYAGSSSGLAGIASTSVSAPVTSVAFGNLDRDAYLDAALVAGGQLAILHGHDAHAAAVGANTNVVLESVPLVSAAISVDTGTFLPDRDPRAQMAVLSSDGSIQIIARAAFDTRPRSAEERRAMALGSLSGHPVALPPLDPKEGWTIAETFPARASSGTSSRTPILMSTRISGQAMDDIVVLDGNASRLHLVSHVNVSSANGLVGKLPASAEGDLALSSASAPVAAIRMRVNIDGRPGVVMLNEGQAAPSVMMPLPDPTFTVNTTTDLLSGTPNACLTAVAGQCSLRQAIKEANATVGVDTISIPAGTYTLTLTGANKEATGETNDYGSLDIRDGVNIVGAVDGSGNPTSIIQAGTTNANGIDKVFTINPNGDLAFDTHLSNLKIQFGKNPGSFGGGLTLPHGFGGGLFWEANGTSTLTMTNCVVTDNSTVDGDGGGIVGDDFVNGTAVFTMTNSTVQNNTVNESSTGGSGVGGGIFVGSGTAIVINNSLISNNNATQVAGAGGQGGGIFLFGPGNGTTQSAIHGSTISGNHAAGQGGGIYTGQGLLIDQGTIISNNVSGSDGGGLLSSLGISGTFAGGETTTLSKVTISGNAASGNGGGIMVGSSTTGNSLVMHFSRLAGNTAATGRNLATSGGAVTATNNWWGTNAAAGTTNQSTGGTVTFDPFIALTHTASPATIRINQSTTLTASFLQDNHGTAISVSNLDALLGLPITFNNAVDGTITGPQATIQSNGTATATFNAGNVAGGGKADAVVDQATVTANIVVLQPLSIVKSFNPATVAVNATSTLTFSVTNPNVIAVDANFTDTFPANLVVAATPAATNTCGGTFSPVAGAGSVSFTNAALAVGSCTITVNVSSAVDNVYSNSVTINSTAAGTGAQSTSSDSLTVINPPAIAKAFGAATVPLNGTTSLTFTLTSTNANLTLNGVAFTDNLPAGLIVATPGNLVSNCSGTAAAVDGSSSVSLSGASLAPGASCTVSVNVTGTTAGVKNNSVQATSTNAGTGNTSNASITVVAPPVIIKAFGAASIPLNGSTSLSFTIQNNNTTTTLTGTGFSDTLPAGLVISTPNGLTGTCGGGTITATQGTNVISLSGASLAASASCTFSVNVTGAAAGDQNNTTGNVTSTEGGTGGTASASIKVIAPPSIAKAFNPATIALNATTSLTFTITNPAANTAALTGVAFGDGLPLGAVTADSTATVCGGTLTTTAPTLITHASSILLSGATIAINSQCQFSVTVTGAASGQYTNTTGSVTSTNGGTGNTATANLTVATPPTIAKSFGAAAIPLNGTTSLTFNITNPNTTLALTGLAFTDNLPAGLVVASTPNLNSTCGGTPTAVGGAGSISLAGGILATSASCTVSVNVTGTTSGAKNNSVQVTSAETGAGNTSNASITVLGPPVIIKAFGAASIPLNGSTSLTFTIQNNNTTTTLTGVGYSDTLPAGLVISTPNGQTGTCGGGIITATASTNVISLSGASLAASSSCTFSVNVTGTTGGTKNNTTGQVTSTEGGTGGTASASIAVVAPPSIAKTFNPTSIAVNGTTSLTFTITNPAANAVVLTGVGFFDAFPIDALNTANSSSTVCGGTLTTTAITLITHAASVSLSGATIAANSQCQFSVTVTGAVSGQYTNTTGSVTSTNGGTGNTASASLNVGTPPTITKAFGAASILVNGTTSLTFSINNPNTTLALTGVAFSDALPAGMVVATPNGLTGSCGAGAITGTAGSSSVTLTGGTLAASASCTFSVNVTGTTAAVMSNTTGAISSTESGPGVTSNTATITAIGPPSIAKSFGAASINVIATTTLSFTITNPNATVALTGVAVGDTLPAGLAVANPNGLTGSCGAGTITAVATSSTVSLSGGTIAAGGSCTFSVNVTGVGGGNQVNTTGAVTSTNAGTGNTATASITVLLPDLTITKTHVGNFAQSGTGSYTIAVSNAGTGSTVGTVTVKDTPPGSLTVTAISGTGWTCTLATQTCTNATGLAAGASYPTITVTVTVAGNAPASVTNSATVSGGGESNTANDTANDVTTIAPGIVITAVNGTATVARGLGAAFMFNVTQAPGLSLGTITFICSGLPAGASCAFTPPSVTVLPAQVTLTVSTTTLGLAQNRIPGPLGGLNYLFAVMMLPFLGLVPMGAISGRRNRKRVIWLVLIVFALLLLAGCGFHQHPVQPSVGPGTYNITVTAMSSTGGVQAQSVVTLIVQ